MRRMKIRIRGILLLAAVVVFAFTCQAGPLEDFFEWIEEDPMENEKSVYTEEEMVKDALACLEERYSAAFEIEPDGRTFGHQNGSEDGPMTLRAYAHPTDREEERFYVIVTEPDSIRDNYWVYEYQPEVAARVQKDLDTAGLTAGIVVDYPATAGRPSQILTAEQLLEDPKCILFFEPTAEDQEDSSAYVPLIRQWMQFLYALDYNWYLELHRISDNKVIFTLDPGDNGFTGAEDWSDSLIESYIREG